MHTTSLMVPDAQPDLNAMLTLETGVSVLSKSRCLARVALLFGVEQEQCDLSAQDTHQAEGQQRQFPGSRHWVRTPNRKHLVAGHRRGGQLRRR